MTEQGGPAEEPKDGVPVSSTEQPAKKDRGVLYGCLGVVALVIGLPVACTVAFSGSGSDNDRPPSDVEVRNVCRDWAGERLYAPADAEFSDEVVTGSGPWTVTGVVDAPNRLGVTLRHDYTCEIRLEDDTYRGRADVYER